MAKVEGFINVDNITYSGKEAQDIFSKDVYDIDLRSYGVTLMDGVKGKTKLYTGEMGDVFQEYTCPFTPEGEVSLSEAFIEPVAIKVNMEECYDKFWNTFLVEQTSITLNGGIPQTFSEWFFDKLRKKMAKEYQEIAWQGNTDISSAATGYAYKKVTDGWEKLITENGNFVQISGLTVDNIIGEVEKVITSGMAVADSYGTDTEKYKIFMNHADVRLLEVALGKLCCPNSVNAVFTNYARENGRIYVMGYEVVPTMQSKGKVIFAPAANLVLGFDTFDSHIEYKLIDMRNTTGDNMFRVIALTNIAVGLIFPELAVIGFDAN